MPDPKYGEVVGAWIVREAQTAISKEETRRVVADGMNPQVRRAPASIRLRRSAAECGVRRLVSVAQNCRTRLAVRTRIAAVAIASATCADHDPFPLYSIRTRRHGCGSWGRTGCQRRYRRRRAGRCRSTSCGSGRRSSRGRALAVRLRTVGSVRGRCSCAAIRDAVGGRHSCRCRGGKCCIYSCHSLKT